jgi:hypothetical protein
MGRHEAVRRQEPRSRQQNYRNPAQTPGNRQRNYNSSTEPVTAQSETLESELARPEPARSLLPKIHQTQIHQTQIHQRPSKKIPSGLIRFFKRYPLLLILAVWAIFLLLAGLAVANMLNLDSSKRSSSASLSPAPTSEPSASVLAPTALGSAAPLPSSAGSAASVEHQDLGRPQGEGLPLLSLMAIALTCATGCIVFLQCLQPRRPSKRLQSFASRSAVSGKSRMNSEGSRLQSDSAGSSRTSLESSLRSVEASVVPQETHQPLDWEEPSLADSLDLRQRQPLSHWL